MPPSDIILISVSYLIGSIPFGVVIARLLGKADPRSGGSGNIGATNVSRTLGKGAGIATLICDVLKGSLPVAYALYFHPGANSFIVSLTALAAFSGHLFPVYLRFKGGKGVATALGVMIVISPVATVLLVAVFVVLVALTRYVSLGSICAAVTMPLALKYLTGQDEFVLFGRSIPTARDGRLQVVGVTETMAAARVLSMADNVFRQGVVVRLTKKMR